MGWIAFGVSLAVAALLVPRLLAMLEARGSLRTNFRGRRLASPSGLTVVLASLAALAPLALVGGVVGEELVDGDLSRWLAFLLGVALLGLVDDVFGGAEEPDAPRGWRGHGAALGRGEISTGALKAVGTVGLAAFALADRSDSPGRLLVGVALLAAATNLLNLLDTRPGRAVKAFVLIAAVLSAAAWSTRSASALAVFLGPLAVAGWSDLRERSMLGDTGSNLLGALAAVWLVESLGAGGEAAALAVVLLLTVLGEFRSLGKSVERIPLVRHLDSLGRSDWHT